MKQQALHDLDPSMHAYLATLPRIERAYAASFAHWSVLLSDPDEAVYESAPFGVGIRNERRSAIRRTVSRILAPVIEVPHAC